MYALVLIAASLLALRLILRRNPYIGGLATMLIIVFCVVRMHKRAKSKLLLLVEKDRTQWNLVGEPGLMFVPFVPRVFPEADSVLGCFYFCASRNARARSHFYV